MTQEQFEALVKRLEQEAAAHPARYRRKLGALALLGYGYIGGTLVLLIGGATLIGWLATVSAAILLLLKKIGWALLVLIYAVLRAMWVKLPVPQGRLLASREFPQLFVLIDEIRLKVGAPSVDRVLLTGDFLTMESQADPGLLEQALSPLKHLQGRVFACLGNHDHEALLTVRRALSNNGVRLLVDEAVSLDTAAGRVQLVGMDFVWRERKEHLARVCQAHPREAGALRIVLLHDPGAFVHLPEGEADLVLSGHTHGGQVGLVSLGLPYTMMRAFVKMPDHGLWARGTDRLYVHRGTGHYGFPLRLGVPSEESVLTVHSPAHHGAPLPS